MTILFSGNTAWSLYNFRGDVMRELHKMGHKIITAAPPDKYVESLEAAGYKFMPITISSKGTNPFEDMKLCFDYINLLKSEKVDFIFFYTIKPNIYGSMAARFCKIPHIAVTTGLGYTFVNNNIISKIARILYKAAFISPKEVWFLNSEDHDIFIKEKLVSPARAKTIPGEGINLEYFTPAEISENNQHTPFTFLLMARMLYDKGIKEYVEAAFEVKKEFPETRFLLLGQAGTLNPSSISEETLHEWEKQGAVTWLGTTSDVRPYINQSDCVVLPTAYREGVPRSLMEAAAMAKPIITTNIAGCRDVLDDGINGFFCEIKNSPSLAQALVRMLKLTSDQRRKMGAAGREKMRRQFDINHIIQLYIDAIKKDA